MNIGKTLTWAFWLLLTLIASIYMGLKMTGEDKDKEMFLIGETTHGHYQIEMACSACHTDSFGGKESLQSACLDCHSEELKMADDSHPKSKFTDPRNASSLEILDARYCITCHQEHNKDITNPMGLTLQEDYCYRCHMDVAEERPTHEGLEFNSCATAGCHNYHDNKALYEDFIEKHLDEPSIKSDGRVKQRNLADFIKATAPSQFQALAEKDADVPESVMNKAKSAKQSLMYKSITGHWLMSKHSKAGVNCSDCHSDNSKQITWADKPSQAVCSNCHENEYKGFTDGKHGMRIKQGLSAMSPAMARLPMLADSHDKELGCNSCHISHEYNTSSASVEACMDCHNDEHTLAYKQSAHFDLWQKEKAGIGETGSGVSCATCHLPRETITDKGVKRILVQHNQNANLRPNEKMIRSVCMECHGLGFSINALADEALIKRNFKGLPTTKVESMTWVKSRVLEREKASSNSKIIKE